MRHATYVPFVLTLAALGAASCGRLMQKGSDDKALPPSPAAAAAGSSAVPAADAPTAGATAPASGSEAGSDEAAASGTDSAASDPFAALKADEGSLFAACAAAGAKAPVPADTVVSFLAFVNALPRPVSVPCLIAALPRPLRLNGANSVASAQLSPDPRTPRLFILLGRLIVTLNGAAFPSAMAETVEFSELVGDGMFSVKGELAFPLTAGATLANAYDHMLPGGAAPTICAECHDGEAHAGDAYPATAYKSLALRPSSAHATDQAELLKIAAKCVTTWGESERCAKLRATQSGGESRSFDFPDGMIPR